MIWVSSDTYSAALSRGHEPAEPGRDDDLRQGRGERRTAENGAATAGCRSPGGKTGGYGAMGELKRTPALLRIACPRVTAGPATGTCSDARPTGPSWLQSADKSR